MPRKQSYLPVSHYSKCCCNGLQHCAQFVHNQTRRTSVSYSNETPCYIYLVSTPSKKNWGILCRNLGDVSTNHHAVSLRVKSLLDSCNEGLDEHENSDQSSTRADDEDEAGLVMQVDASLLPHYKSVFCYSNI